MLESIAIALILNRDLAVGIAKALDLATLLQCSPLARIKLGSLGTLEFDLPRLREALEISLEEALEAVAERTRGRPLSI